jgi:type I restriction enzyme S subunit
MPKLRFNGFNDVWHSTNLEELTDISTGKLDANAMVEKGKYDFFTSGIAKFKIDRAAFQGPAITIAGNGATVGYMHLADGQFNAYQRTYVLTNLKIDRQFLFSQIGRKLPKKIAEEARTGNIPYIVIGMLTKLQISFPRSKIEQEQIGSFLSAIDRLIVKQKEKVSRIKYLKKGYLQKMFPADDEDEPEIRLKGFNAPWKSKKLGEMGFFISDGNYGSLYPKSNQFVKTGVPFLRVNNMRDGYLVDDDLVFISADLNKILTSGHLLNNDILITNRGEIGLIAYVNKKYEGSNINAQICLIRTLNKLDSKYLHQFLQTQYAQSQLQSLQTGSALKQLPRKRLDDLIILRPIDNGEDTKIGSFLSAIDRLIKKEEAAIERYESLKKGYLQKIFAD